VTPHTPFIGILGLLIAGLYVGGAAWLAWWMLEPINRVAGHLQATTRYLLTDFLGLMVLLQAALAVVGRAIDTKPGEDRSPYWIVLFVALLLMFVLWAASVSVVSRAGITLPLRRAVLILVLVPGALAEIMAVPILLTGCYLSVTVRPGDWAARFWSESLQVRILGLVASIVLAILWGLTVRWLSFWVLAAPAQPQAAGAVSDSAASV